MGNVLSLLNKKQTTKCKYEVTITTSNGYLGAGGVKNIVSLEMTGENGDKTSELVLCNELEINFQRGKTDVFEVEMEDVGLPIIIRLRLQNVLNDPWAVREVVVKYQDTEAIFPVHDWIETEITVTRGEALLHHKIDNIHVKSMRKQEVEKNQTKLQWVPTPGPSDLGRGLPRFVNSSSFANLPLIFKPTEIWSKSFFGNAFDTAVLNALKKLEGSFFKLDSLESYERLFDTHEPANAKRSPFLDRWKTDEEFGRQQLNGISPTSLERCTKIPENCQITGDDVNALLGEKTLEEEMEAGKMYIADYSQIYQGVTRNKNEKEEQLYCPDAICIFHVNDADNLVPVAIQLIPNDPDTVFTPNDSEDDWLLAKMYFKVAFGNMHEWHYHFVLTHNVMEPVAVSMFRCFPRSHPLYKFLRPHLQTVTVINALARTNLIAAGSAANSALAIEGEGLARHTFKDFTFSDLIIPDLLKKKGIDNKEKLPKFYYRDDALALWELIDKFVAEVIGNYYCLDEDVTKDEDLQRFVKDLGEEGLGWSDGTTRGIPVPINTIQELIKICTCIIFTSSVQHAAVNFPQYEMYKYIPNGPVAMRLPPHKKGEATLQRILDSLPNTVMSVVSISIAKSLSTYTKDEIYLGNYPVKLFSEPGVLEAIERYRESLDKYAADVRERNEKAEHPYEQLLPNHVPNSIAI